MARKTLFAGLQQLDPLDPLSTDDYSFQAQNPDIIDRLLEVGARTHRHDAHAALADPTAAPGVVVVASGGVIPADVTISFGYTWVDQDRGETAASPLEAGATDAAIDAPEELLELTADYAAGTLRSDSYYYGRTWTDDAGGETELGAIESVDVEPYPEAQVFITGLSSGMVAAGASGWRLYRARGGDDFTLLATGSGDALTDDGSLCPDCTDSPPEENTTQRFASMVVTIPALPSGATGWRLYGSLDGAFFDTYSLAGSGTASGAVAISDFNPEYGRPPAASLSIGGAQKIDPDTELLDWHWKRPVDTYADLPATGNEHGDVRLVQDEVNAYGWVDTGSGDAWQLVGSPGGGGDRHEGHTFTYMGAVASGVMPGFFSVEPQYPHTVCQLVGVRHWLPAGSAVCSLRGINGTILPAFDHFGVTPGLAGTSPGYTAGTYDVDDGEYLELIVHAASGGARNLSVTLDEWIY